MYTYLERKITPNVADDELSRVDDLDVRAVFLIDWLIDANVLCPTRLEISHGLLRVHVAVVGCAELDGTDVLFEKILLITDGLEKHALGTEPGVVEDSSDVLAALLGAVGGVEGSDTNTVLAHVVDEVDESGIAGHESRGSTLGIGGIVEVGGHPGTTELTSIVTDVEDLRRNVMEEAEEAADALCNMSLSGGR